MTIEREQELLRAKGFLVIVPTGWHDVVCWRCLDKDGNAVSSTDTTQVERLEVAPTFSAKIAEEAGPFWTHLRWVAYAKKHGRNELTVPPRHFSNPIAAATWLLAKVAER